MVEGELPVQPTNSSMPNHLLPEGNGGAAAAQQNNFTQQVEISKVNDTEGLKQPEQAAAAQQQRNNKVGRNNNSND